MSLAGIWSSTPSAVFRLSIFKTAVYFRTKVLKDIGARVTVCDDLPMLSVRSLGSWDSLEVITMMLPSGPWPPQQSV